MIIMNNNHDDNNNMMMMMMMIMMMMNYESLSLPQPLNRNCALCFNETQINKNDIISSYRVHLESFATTAADVALTVAVDRTFRKTFEASSRHPRNSNAVLHFIMTQDKISNLPKNSCNKWDDFSLFLCMFSITILRSAAF